MRTLWSDLDRPVRIKSQARNTQPIRGVSDDMACKGVQALAPPGSRKKIWGKKKHGEENENSAFERLDWELSLKSLKVYWQTPEC